MTSTEAVKACLMTMLNASLRFQGMADMRVVGLSDDYAIALVRYKGNVAAVQAQTLLSSN